MYEPQVILGNYFNSRTKVQLLESKRMGEQGATTQYSILTPRNTLVILPQSWMIITKSETYDCRRSKVSR